MAIDFPLTPELEAIRMRIRTFVDDVIKPEEAKLEGHDGEEPVTGKERNEILIGLRKKPQKIKGFWLPHMPEEGGGGDSASCSPWCKQSSQTQ
ncbi:MAG: hypothetical protein CM15mP49_35360 [Actinomycetota bacterium]|nr:MAG: hypothetical protein CM15mP49_35360 [Actinomycetota bacterium]